MWRNRTFFVVGVEIFISPLEGNFQYLSKLSLDSAIIVLQSVLQNHLYGFSNIIY